jgi:hypothetical protein
MIPVDERVDNGMDVLYEYFGSTDWVWDIDLETLDQYSIETCVVSQLFGGYSEGVEILFGLGTDAAQQCEHGFDSMADMEDYAALTEEWALRIRNLRSCTINPKSPSWQQNFVDAVDAPIDTFPQKTTDLFIPIQTTARIALTDQQIGRLWREARDEGFTDIEDYLAERFEEVALEATHEIEV